MKNSIEYPDLVLYFLFYELVFEISFIPFRFRDSLIRDMTAILF